uniref:somatostatin receptor type 1-like n=1 Tax=Myxine glutinosa TaxID=7769 RepID=UPI00358F3342
DESWWDDCPWDKEELIGDASAAAKAQNALVSVHLVEKSEDSRTDASSAEASQSLKKWSPAISDSEYEDRNGTAVQLWTTDASTVVICCIYIIVCAIGLTGNSLVIYIILRYAKMKTATNIYILNLAVADELFMLSLPLLATYTAIHHWPFGSLICRLLLTVDGINMFTSIYCLTVLSFDRYVAVVHPIRSARYRRPSVAKIINAAVWVISLVVIMPIVIYAGTETVDDGGIVCNLLWPHPKSLWSSAFVVYTFLLGFLLPVVSICLCYILIIVKMRVVALKAGWQQRKKSELKITRMVMMVVAVFVICWMPFYIIQLMNVFLQNVDTRITHPFVILSYANSCANPILYSFLSENFKRLFQRILCLRWLRRGEDPLDYRAAEPCHRAGPRAEVIEAVVPVVDLSQQRVVPPLRAAEGTLQEAHSHHPAVLTLTECHDGSLSLRNGVCITRSTSM